MAAVASLVILLDSKFVRAATILRECAITRVRVTIVNLSKLRIVKRSSRGRDIEVKHHSTINGVTVSNCVRLSFALLFET